MHIGVAFGLLTLGAGAAAGSGDAASAQAQLAVAQSAMCQPQNAPVAGADSDPDAAAAAALRLQQAAQVWVDAWDLAGRPPLPRQQVAACRPEGVVPLYLEALIAMSQADFEAAQSAVDQALAQAPQAWCAGLRLRQGLCALHRGRPQEALGYLQAAQDADSKRVATRLAAAQAYLALERPADAVACLKPILTPATQAPGSRDIEQARSLVSRAIESGAGPIRPPERAAMRHLLAMAQSAQADEQTATEALSLAEAVPRPRVQTAAALVALKAQKAQAGRRLLQHALAQTQTDPDPARLLALYNVEHGGPAAALPCLLLAAERDPFNTETQTLIAELQERTGHTHAAQDTLVALMRLEPQQARHQAAWRRLRELNTLLQKDAAP